MMSDFDRDKMVAESTARKIKRWLGTYIKLLKGRDKRLIGGLAGCPITPELKEAITEFNYKATHPLFSDRLVSEIRALQHNKIEPALDMYFDGVIPLEDILHGKQRHTQLEVLEGKISDEELDEIDKLEAEEDGSE